jgi:hypothetical protein
MQNRSIHQGDFNGIYRHGAGRWWICRVRKDCVDGCSSLQFHVYPAVSFYDHKATDHHYKKAEQREDSCFSGQLSHVVSFAKEYGVSRSQFFGRSEPMSPRSKKPSTSGSARRGHLQNIIQYASKSEFTSGRGRYFTMAFIGLPS